MSMEIAVEILRQLGGDRFVAMTGARDLVGFDSPEGRIRGGLTFGLGRNAGRVSKVAIRLTTADLYDVTFYTGSPVKIRILAEHADVYAENLVELFEEATELRATLAPREAAPEVDRYGAVLASRADLPAVSS